MKKLKLTNLAKNEISKKEMIKGGKMEAACNSVPNGCGCGCIYEGQGGSTSFNNHYANNDLGISTHGY